MSLSTFKKSIFLLSLCFIGFGLSAQKTTTIITGATIHVGNGEIIENGVVVLSNGKIELVGKTLNTLYKNAKTIDAKGKHIYPGLIGMNTIVGLNEIDAARATRDFNEQGSVNPNVRALIAYNTDSKIIPTLVFNGILFTQVVPQGGLISGTSSLMKTQGWNWEDAAPTVLLNEIDYELL
jgi:imidazolonepropionase-like amidohydrolase